MALKIIFMGTPEFSVPILKSIHNSKHNILQVYTQPPKRKNRGQSINLTPIHKFSNENSIRVRCPDELSTDEEFNNLKQKKPDVVVVVAYGKLIPSKFLNMKNIKFINIHASLLPKWRGAAPIQRSIMNLDKETGISIMKIIPKLDAGPVMMKSKVKITKNSNLENLSKELSILGAYTILESLDVIERNSENFIDQVEKDATYAKKIDKKESKIDWSIEAKKVVAKINALYPNPGSWFEYKGSRLKVIKAIEVEEKGRPGQILNTKFTIACSQNAIQVLQLQKEGKKSMSVGEYLKGNILEIGYNVS
jgi:methionyl-tRNA formyltransferase